MLCQLFSQAVDVLLLLAYPLFELGVLGAQLLVLGPDFVDVLYGHGAEERLCEVSLEVVRVAALIDLAILQDLFQRL